ncbi:MAG: hypothetical protein JWO06_871 [Bacteroidota bacterium]|nr:hypothetical protein [Bacteroidota bacterium]
MKLGRNLFKFRSVKLPLGLLALVFCLSVSSCFKEKNIAPPSSKGIGQTHVIPLGSDYGTQCFYSLATNTVLSSNSRIAYDLLFDCAPDSFNIWLNSAKFMAALKTTKTDINAVTIEDTTGGNWNYERGSYNIDSNALGAWWATTGSEPTSAGKVYIIDLGVDLGGNPLGFVKLKVNNFYGTSYSVTYNSLTGTDSGTILIQKDPTRNYRYLSLIGSGQLLNIEPDKSKWDLLFTHYTTVFYVPYVLNYQVTGVLSNPARVSAYVDSTTSGFSNVTIGNFNVNKLQTNRDAIGYDWKTWTGVLYNTKTYYVYFIKTGENQIYKFHFISFNDNQGNKGYPTFEYSLL